MMKQQVLKALANPARIFYVPYTLAVVNFVVQFLVYIVIFVISLIIQGVDTGVSPLFFLISLCVVHSILAGMAKKDPQLGQIVFARLNLFSRHIRKRLAA